MKNSLSFILVSSFLIFGLSGCTLSFVPISPSVTPSLVPPTSKTEPTATAVIPPTTSLMPTPIPISSCSPYANVRGEINNDIPGYVNIVSVSTNLDGTKLIVVFTLREIPNEITVDNNKINKGEVEIAFGVAIDIDNNSKTGMPAFVADSGYGYDTFLQALHFKQGSETNMSILDLLANDTYVWIPKVSDLNNDSEYTISSDESGEITVDQTKRTITLSADIMGITPSSYLHFFTYLADDTKKIIDQVCQR